ncbi:MAG: malate dehydrogenase [Bacteroidaceae bacterium]|jgi:malate dehydrogenase|uniref:malate dehydrogenase n=1 Tax=unclassified Bacteroides TaxID=2646097 RepID=UPI0004E2292F|nr:MULTISPECIES: malate dehydrogenase [unclassified Bacteroides]MBP3245698.1 malate dehydrogenase [Bacteroidaceae bacterium]MBQ1677275.1 malate dehydrogenase [Bacteroidaceae bacterium]MCR4700105.1 malate dehydrogenase [Bacteroidaceae bacterium]
MNFLTNEKLVIVGAGGMIGSNMVQSVLMLGLTPNICLYDIFEPGVHGVADEMAHCAFPGANITWTVDPKTAFTGAKYIISSGGAPRKEGMTREDLLKGNCQIAAQFGDYIKEYCPDVKHVVVIFNPADVTALTALIHSGLKPNQLTSLAALDSTRLQQQLAQEFGVQQDKVTGAHTYGGHGEQMAVFASKVKVDGKPLADLPLSAERWAEIKHNTIQGGSNIIKLRGRSSFQSPAYQAVKMIEGAMGGEPFTLPAGCYVNNDKLGYKNVMMAMPTTIDKDGVHFTEPEGTADEMAALQASYEHLQKMRDELVTLGIIPAIKDWGTLNPNL